LEWFKKFLHQRWIATKYNNCISTYKQTKTGLPQGAVTSTTLFNIYINDLPERSKSVNGIQTCMFADDVVIWTKTKNKKNQQLILEKTMNEALG
jgi:retron-type reverse transcriptase